MDYIYGNINPIDFNFKGLTSDSVKVIVDNVARTISAELVKDPESIVSLYDLDLNQYYTETSLQILLLFLSGISGDTLNLFYDGATRELDLSTLTNYQIVKAHLELHENELDTVTDLYFKLVSSTNGEPTFEFLLGDVKLTLTNSSIDGKIVKYQTKLTQGENIVINEEGVISATGNVTTEQLETAITEAFDTHSINFYLNDKGKIELNSRIYEWMSSDETFDNRIMFLSVDDNIPSACVISKFIDGNSYEIRIESGEFGSITLTCSDKPEYSDNWEVNLDTYFPPIYNNGDFSPYLEISNGEVVEDTIINPTWCTSFGNRLRMFEAMPIKARCSIDGLREICTIYAISEISDTVTICIQTSKGEYKLTYQFESDPL